MILCPKTKKNIICENMQAELMEMEDDSSKPLCWQGWADKDRRFGLEMQHPYSELVLTSQKTIETRAYPLPEALLNAKIEILQSEKGVDGVSSVPNKVSLRMVNDLFSTHPSPSVKRIGWVTFKTCLQYKSREHFESDALLHLVPLNSGYGWSNERPMYGWVVGTSKKEVTEDDKNLATVAIRRMRSLFEIIRT